MSLCRSGVRGVLVGLLKVCCLMAIVPSADSPVDAAELVAGQQAAAVFTGHGEPLRYWRFTPSKYQSGTPERWPLLIFLHGAGESGLDLELVKVHGPPKLCVQRPADFPMFIVSPQASDTNTHRESYWGRWDERQLSAWLDELLETLPIDPDRVYLTGLSMGGYGTWRWAALEPQRFAAIAPICGGGYPKMAWRLKELPIWAFHGELDQVVVLSESTSMIEAIEKVGGKPQLTVYSGVGHDSWTETYNNPELYTWLLSQRRGATTAR